jgi:DNA-binding transcriptional regulator YbjK
MYTMLFQRNDGRAHEERRDVILEAAVRIIGQGGPDAITHRAVAARAGVPLGSVTYYFDSREELVREAFRFYVASASRFLAALESAAAPADAGELADFLVDVARREFMEPELVRAEYEMILNAARDETLAREFNDYERGLESRLAARLERLGAARPVDSARTLIDLVRGFELERFTRPDADLEDLRRRLLAVIGMLVASDAAPVRRGAARSSSPSASIHKPNVVRRRTR